MSVVENARGRGTYSGIIPVGAPGTRGWWRTLIGGGVKVLLTVEDCDGVRREE